MVEQSFRVLLPDTEATEKFGLALAQAIEDRAVVALVGPLGAGKTTLVKAVAAGLGVEEVVNSPTFTMLNEYHSGRLSLYHMDLYRLSEDAVPAPLDLLLAEVEEFIETSMVAMIEWAELFPSVCANGELGSSNQSYLAGIDHLKLELSYHAATPLKGRSSPTQTHPDSHSSRSILVTTFGETSRRLAHRLRGEYSAMETK